LSVDGTGVPALDAVLVWGGVVTAAAGALAVLWRAVRRVRRVAHRVEEFLHDWQGVPSRPGVEGRPGVMARLAEIEARVAAVVHEVRPNNGGSLRDAVDRVDRRMASTAGDPAGEHRPEGQP
jgi:hypothetical protein